MYNTQIIILIFIVISVIAFILYKIKNNEKFTTEKNRIILYFSPSCGHCKSFMGTWNEFEKRINTHNDINLVATKMNCQNNECPNIDGFPTVLLHKNTGETVKFAENRTLKNLEDFVKKHC
jgi:thiol-disulfide isomerase/thioredoxin